MNAHLEALTRIMKKVKTKVHAMKDVDKNVSDILDRVSRIRQDTQNLGTRLKHTETVANDTAEVVCDTHQNVIELAASVEEMRNDLGTRVEHTQTMVNDLSEAVRCTHTSVHELAEMVAGMRNDLDNRDRATGRYCIHMHDRFHFVNCRLRAIMEHLNVPLPVEEAHMW